MDYDLFAKPLSMRRILRLFWSNSKHLKCRIIGHKVAAAISKRKNAWLNKFDYSDVNINICLSSMRTKNRDIKIKQIMVVPWTRCTYYGYCRPQSPNKTNSHTDLKLNRMSKTNWMGRMNCKNVKLYIGNRESSFHTFWNVL